MKKTTTHLIMLAVMLAISACGNYTSNKVVNSHNTTTTNENLNNVTYLRPDVETVDENGTKTSFKTVCNIDCSHVTAAGGYIIVSSETATDGLTGDIIVKVGELVIHPVVTYTDYDTVKIYAKVYLPENDTNEVKTWQISTYATDGNNTVPICGGVCHQPGQTEQTDTNTTEQTDTNTTDQ